MIGTVPLHYLLILDESIPFGGRPRLAISSVVNIFLVGCRPTFVPTVVGCKHTPGLTWVGAKSGLSAVSVIAILHHRNRNQNVLYTRKQATVRTFTCII